MGLVLVGSRARSTQEPLREAVTVLSRAIEDASYTNLSTDIRDPTERDYNQRRDIIVNAQAAGAILRENIYAERDQAPFDRVARSVALARRLARPMG